MNPKQIGKLGENIACSYLKNKGYRILDRNYTLKWAKGPLRGEIDIVAKKDGVISFVEVKALRLAALPNFAQGENCFLPEDRVNFAKQKQLIKICQNWLAEKKIPLDSRWQIDVVSLILERDNKAKVRHFENITS